MFRVGSIVGDIKLKTAEWTGAVRQTTRDTTRIRTELSGLASSATRLGRQIGLLGTAMSAAIGLTARSFLSAASRSEQFATRLTVLLGSAEEGNRLFKAMGEYAGRVPFEFEAVMASATQLAGVIQGGVDAITAWMPLIGDLAAAAGVDIETATSQFIRMYSAGAASADLFRERGILAMLGFKSGVQYTAEETRKKLIEAWLDPASKFRGATEELADDWTGLTSMMADKWFQLRATIMGAGLFDKLKSGLAALNHAWDANKDRIDAWVTSHASMIQSIALGTAALTTAAVAVGAFSLVLPGLALALKTVASAATMAWAALGGAAVGVPVALVIAAFATIAAELYVLRAAWKQNFEGMGWVLDHWAKQVEERIEGVTTILRIGFRAAAAWVRDAVADMVNNTIRGLKMVYSYAQELARSRSITSALGAAQGVAREDYFGNALAGYDIGGALRDAAYKALPAKIKTIFSMVKTATSGEMDGLWAAVKNQVSDDIDSLADLAREKFPAIAAVFDGLTEEIAQGIAPNVEDLAKAIQGAMGEAAEGAKKAKPEIGGVGDALEEAMIEAQLLRAELETIAQWQARGEEIWYSLHPAQDMVRTLTEEVQMLQVALRYDEETTGLLARDLWQRFESMGTSALRNVLAEVRAVSPEIATEFEAILTEERQKQWLGSLESLSSRARQFASVIQGLPNKWQRLQTVAVAALQAIDLGLSAAKAATQGWTGALDLVASGIEMAATAMGLLGDKADKELSNIEQMFDELETMIDGWADRLTDTLVDFVKTGKASFTELVDSILEDILRLTIHYAISEPLAQLLTSGFARGGVFSNGAVIPFAGGGIVTSPKFFPMANGNVGLMGENGPEAVMPLGRDAAGRLGVLATGGAVEVNIHDYRSSGSPVEVRQSRTARGAPRLDVVIRDAMRQAIATGGLDDVLGAAYGMSRVGVGR